MVTHAHDTELQRQWFRAKLASEKGKMDAVKLVKEGKGDFTLLDARDRASYERSHIPGALSMPLDGIEERLTSLDPEREYVTYCWNST